MRFEEYDSDEICEECGENTVEYFDNDDDKMICRSCYQKRLEEIEAADDAEYEATTAQLNADVAELTRVAEGMGYEVGDDHRGGRQSRYIKVTEADEMNKYPETIWVRISDHNGVGNKADGESHMRCDISIINGAVWMPEEYSNGYELVEEMTIEAAIEAAFKELND